MTSAFWETWQATKRSWPFLTAIMILVVSGLVQGFWTQRWQSGEKLQDAVVRLEKVAPTFDDWRSESVDMPSRAIQEAGLGGCWMRRYTHEPSGQAVTVLLMCGSAGPTAVHTPEWCYSGAGYEMITKPHRYSVPSENGLQAAQFWRAKFNRPAADALAEIRIWWAWNGTGTWEAPDSPRLTFARLPVLYKLYLIREITSANDRLDDDVCLEFLRQFLPGLAESLFPTAGSAPD